MKIVITGGAGFFGSHILEAAIERYPNARFIVFDKLTYAGDLRNIEEAEERANVEVVVGDVCDLSTCRKTLSGADLVIHTAAESHVDNSFGNSLEFTRTNVYGTHVLIEASRFENVPRFIHVSTDEVYGEIATGLADESFPIAPTNPYSSSKAAAEHIVLGYWKSYKSPIIMVRPNNIFGTRQYPEKIIPLFIGRLLAGRKVPLHGKGLNSRHYLAVRDAAQAIICICDRGELMTTYNIGSEDEYTNLEVAEMICRYFEVDPKERIEFVPDRPYNDCRYGITSEKIKALDWAPISKLEDELPSVAEWYRANINRYIAVD